jgi:hypothetical protein
LSGFPKLSGFFFPYKPQAILCKMQFKIGHL